MTQFIKVYDNDGCVDCEIDGLNSLDAAVGRYLDTGRDSVVTLTMCDGDEYNVKASVVGTWIISTPEGRAKNIRLNAEFKEEAKATKQALGVWEDE